MKNLPALLLAALSTAGPIEAAAPALTTPEIYRRCCAAGVEVLIDGRHSGSGWFANTNGLVVTAAHLCRQPGKQVEIIPTAGGRLPVIVLAIDRGHDVAVLRTRQ
jgi:S1-C subfamily serine protease